MAYLPGMLEKAMTEHLPQNRELARLDTRQQSLVPGVHMGETLGDPGELLFSLFMNNKTEGWGAKALTALIYGGASMDAQAAWPRASTGPR